MNPSRSWSKSLIVSLSCTLLSLAFQGHLSAEMREVPGPGCSDGPTEIECITPDGRLLRISRIEENTPATVKDDAISCPLREGETVFIIGFPKAGLLDRLRFVNENTAASGDVRIAVSNCHLSADSPAWTVVDGSIPFSRKRLFDFSMLGVAAKYVRLSFHVEKAENMMGISIDPHQVRRAAKLAAN